MQDRLEIKSDRLLTIYMQLTQGKVLKKQNLAEQFHVSSRSIQRDIEQLRDFFAEQTLGQDIIYDRQAKGYYLTDTLPRGLTNSEILAVCKILLESRSMMRGEIVPILDKLVDCCVPAESRQAALIAARLINASITNLCLDYMLSEKEVQMLIDTLDSKENLKSLKKLQQNVIMSKTQYKDIVDVLTPIFDEIVKARPVINKEMEQEMMNSMSEDICDKIEDAVGEDSSEEENDE